MNYPFENDTSAVIKKLARKSVRFDKKKNLFCLSAIIVAVAMIMMSLLTVQNIIYQNQKEIEGLHQGIFFDITQDSKEKLLANEEVKSVGLSCNIKTVKENSKELSLIYYDDDMLSLIPAFDGKYPEKASEIAVTDAFFASENKSPEINAIVQLNLDGTLKNYTIVGIYHDKLLPLILFLFHLKNAGNYVEITCLMDMFGLKMQIPLQKTKQQKYYLKFQRRLD